MTEQQPTPVPLVYAAILEVLADLAKAGVGKNQRNTTQNFQYRGVDDVMDALAPSLAKHGLFIVPHVREREVTERESLKGGKLFHVVLLIDYLFMARDGSALSVGPIYGEAMDSGDKATNKAMAVAYKYACTQTFCIPFSGDDPDANTHEVAGAQASRATEGRTPPSTSHAAEREAPPARPTPEIPTGSDGKPRMLRPSGNFGYGKKYAEVPWSVMQSRDLNWFLNAERTPDNIRSKIATELVWRQYDASLLDAARERQRLADQGAANDEDIPFEERRA